MSSRLDEIERLEQGATEEPWEAWEVDNPSWPPEPNYWSFGTTEIGPDNLMQNDAEFIATARNTMPALIRLARAVEGIASWQVEQPSTDDYEQDDMGARMHAVVMERWRICESLRGALSSLQAQPKITDIIKATS